MCARARSSATREGGEEERERELRKNVGHDVHGRTTSLSIAEQTQACLGQHLALDALFDDVKAVRERSERCERAGSAAASSVATDSTVTHALQPVLVHPLHHLVPTGLVQAAGYPLHDGLVVILSLLGPKLVDEAMRPRRVPLGGDDGDGEAGLVVEVVEWGREGGREGGVGGGGGEGRDEAEA